MKAYVLNFSYPDGHIEEIDESFATLESAIRYGDGLLNQVQATERMKKAGVFSASNKAYFTVDLVDLESRKTVYHS